MEKKIQPGSPNASSPEVQDSLLLLPVELWEAPFERWMRLADHLLRDWPGAAPVQGEHRL